MPLTVILNDVSAAHDFSSKVGVAQHEFADAKKGGAGPITLEQLKHLRRYIRIGPIIDCNRDAGDEAAAFRQAGPIRAQQLASRPKPRRCRTGM